MKTESVTIRQIQGYKTVPDRIAEALRDGILRGTLQGGLPLKQDEIAKKFDVSLIPVREALIQLEAKGLITSVRNKGAIVTPLSLEEMRMIFELRKILETGIADIIAVSIGTAQIEALYKLILEMEEEEDVYTFNSLNTLFHQMLCDGTQNTHLIETYRNLFIRVERYCMYIMKETSIKEKIKADHREIVYYIEKKDKEALVNKLIEHAEQSGMVFAEHILHKYEAEAFDWNNL
ncbi:GntR family transcriptional regulator [Cellulosilyticum sp. I15G10I2]|uniref:GntR family transcriptional regulator n=1 Tax=Cellulosilyticum sp. I15G10I2 TaxID=1892843 RepID=UPI001A9A43DD|nr:GntR family transcriptional regulator [Cellulosilyticum sp. I15G10I2]